MTEPLVALQKAIRLSQRRRTDRERAKIITSVLRWFAHAIPINTSSALPKSCLRCVIDAVVPKVLDTGRTFQVKYVRSRRSGNVLRLTHSLVVQRQAAGNVLCGMGSC